MTGSQKNLSTNELSDDELKNVTGGDGKSDPLQSTATNQGKTATKEAEKMWAYLRG